MEKCNFGVRQVNFLGKTICPEDIAPQTHKVKNFFSKLRFPKTKKALQRYLGFVKYYKNYIPRMAGKLHPFYKLLKTDNSINIVQALVDTFDIGQQRLGIHACELSLKQALPGKQLILMTGASFRSAGYALMIEDDPQQKIQLKMETFRTNWFWIKIYLPRHDSKCQFIRKNFWQYIWHLWSLHIFYGKQQLRR